MSSALVSLDEYRGRANVLVPTHQIQQVSPWHAVRVSEVQIDPDPAKGDIYRVGSRKEGDRYVDLYALSKPALMRIAAAAGLVWNWRESRTEVATSDLVIYRAVGAIRLPDGSWQPIMASKEIDLTVIEEELREAAAKTVGAGIWGEDAKAYKGRWEKVQSSNGRETNRYFLDDSEIPRYIEDKVRPQLIQWKKNKHMRAETGAMLRVIRAALGMRSHYTAEELGQPFVVPTIDFRPDYNDPEVKQLLLTQGVQAASSLFGTANSGTFAQLAADGDTVHAPIQCPPEEVEPEIIAVAPADDEDGAGDAGHWMLGDADLEPETDDRCAGCSSSIQDVTVTVAGQERTFLALDIAEQTKTKFGRQLCYSCASRIAAEQRQGGAGA